MEHVCVPGKCTGDESGALAHVHEVVVPIFECCNSVARCKGEHEVPSKCPGAKEENFDPGLRARNE